MRKTLAQRPFDKYVLLGAGAIAVRELFRFMGRDPVARLERKLRQVIHEAGIGAPPAS